MEPFEKFKLEVEQNIINLGKNPGLKSLSRDWMMAMAPYNYVYNFSWLGRPIIQFPQDIMAMQELIWQIKPDLIIETGIAHGGSLIMSASLLALLDYCEAVQNGQLLDPANPRRKVLGIDIDIRPHNRVAIESHFLANRIEIIQGSSIAPEVITEVHKRAKNFGRVMVCLDSNHTHEHVYAELIAYSSLVKSGSYCVVFDTEIENLPSDSFSGRSWSKGNNPMTAVWEFMKTNNRFEIDKEIENKLLITVAPDGYLKCIKD